MPFDGEPIPLPLTPYQWELLTKERRYYARIHERFADSMNAALRRIKETSRAA